jgi:hypothetical protein
MMAESLASSDVRLIFTNSTIKNAGGTNIVPTLSSTTTSNITGLPGQ